MKVYLKGKSSLAIALQLEDRLFSESATIVRIVKENLWNTDLAGNFKNADPALDNEVRSFVFRGIILILLFASMPIINLGQYMP